MKGKRYQRSLVFGLLVLASMVCSAVLPAGRERLSAAPAVHVPASSQFTSPAVVSNNFSFSTDSEGIVFEGMAIPALAQTLASTQPLSTQSADAQTLLRQGIERYEAEQFAEAATIWQQALAKLADDPLNHALVRSNLSLAYQQLGRWQEATEAVSHGLNQLQALPEQNSQHYQEVLAKTLNTQGRLQWYRGQVEDALTTWQKAAGAYRQAGDQTGLVISLINQARALQTLGFSVRAEAELAQVEQLLQQESDPALKATGLQSLGNALRRVGKLEEARRVLQLSVQVAESLSPSVQSAALLDLANTERALGNKALAIGDTKAAQIKFQSAQNLYQQAATIAPSQSTTLQAQLNQLSLLIDTEQTSAAIDLVNQLQLDLANLPPRRSSFYAQLNYARSLLRMGRCQRPGEADASCSVRLESAVDAQDLAQFLANTLQQARVLGDGVAESYALGQLGELYEQTGQWQTAQSLTQQALLKAETLQAADIRYRWEWQLGRLQEKQGERLGALAAYQAAVKSLQTVRNDLLSISTDIQFSFRDDVEPVYRGFVELLLATEQGQSPSQDNLKDAIQQVNALQLAELNNFLGCNLTQGVDIGEVEADLAAAKLYPMILPNKLAIVLELPGQPLLYHEVLQPRAKTLAVLQQLRRDLSAPDRTPEATSGLQQLHQWIIAAFQATLDQQPQVKTLVFVLDGELRNIPMAALYDGQQYLVSQYAIALAPRLELFQPSPRPAKLDVFLGGVGEPQTLENRAFPEIRYLAPELEQIQQLVNARQPLLNQAFTETNLEQQLQAGAFSAVHLKTHGIFSSDPEQTFIVAYQALITGRDLGRLIQLRRLGEASPIELLVLSACSTAQGDNRAVLGLAGVAVQAGARSVVSTLWEAQDLPNTQLMIRFYQELLNPQISRAEALRQAQMHLLAQGYTTPHVWATYVLVGNWL